MKPLKRRWKLGAARAVGAGAGLRGRASALLAGAVLAWGLGLGTGARAAEEVLMTLDPGHFHAALFQREMLPGVSATAHVYAPLGPDLLAHLGRIAQFNARPGQPTRWRLEVHSGPDFLDRALVERPGRLVVLSGNNRGKIDRIERCVRAGLHVLADKPWVIEPGEWSRLAVVLETAARTGVTIWDAMTERFEVTALIQRALVQEEAVFGQPLTGSAEAPAVHLQTGHCLLKEVAGVVSLRPPWFFDAAQQGEGLTDVGTHLVDRVQWTLFPEQAIDWQSDLELVGAARSAMRLTPAQFQRVTGTAAFPAYLAGAVTNGDLEYHGHTSLHYRLRGRHVRLDTRWQFEGEAGGRDTGSFLFRGRRASIEVRSGAATGYRPELYVRPAQAEGAGELERALAAKVAAWAGRWPGLGVRAEGSEFRVTIPDALRTGHEAHFAEVVREFLAYVRDPARQPVWERPCLLAKYWVTTRGIELARRSSHDLSKTPKHIP